MTTHALPPAASGPSRVPLESLEAIIGGLPGVLFSTKDRSLRFTGANDNMLRACGVAARSDFVGRSSADFFPGESGIQYEKHDRYVFGTGMPLLDRLDLTAPVAGRSVWVLISRWPILEGGAPAAVAVIARALPTGAANWRMYERVFKVVRDVDRRLEEDHDVASMAACAGVSPKRLERDFQRVFGAAPARYLTRLRMDNAIGLLATDMHIADVAQSCGYADQSAFTRRFHMLCGVAPSEFRRRMSRAVLHR